MKQKYPGTWKIFMRYGAIDWLLKIAHNMQNTDRYEEPDRFGLVMAAREMHHILCDVKGGPHLAKNDINMPSRKAAIRSPLKTFPPHLPFAFEIPGTLLPDKYEPDRATLLQNDESLATFFGEHSTMWLHEFRKFNLISGWEKDDVEYKTTMTDWTNTWGHCEALHYSEFINRNKVSQLPPNENPRLGRYEGDRKDEMKD